MQYDLELLEDLITVTLSVHQLSKKSLSSDEITVYERLARSEEVRIKKQMKSVVGSPIKEQYKEKYIQRNQQDIIVLKNVLFQYLNTAGVRQFEPAESDAALIRLYKLLLFCLKELLEHIERYFQSYFNLDENVPDSYLMRSSVDLKAAVRQIRKKLTGAEYRSELIDHAIYPIVALCNNKSRTVSYRHFLYIKKLVWELKGIESTNLSLISFNPLTALLVYLNFNSGRYVTYTIHCIVDMINVIPETNKRIERLLLFKKELNQLIVRPGVALKPKCVPIKEQLNAWISEEIHYLEKREPLLSVAPVIKDEMLNDEEKLHFSVSVNVLGLFARAAHDSKLILNEKGTLVFKNISKYCRTVSAKHPGAKSMDKKSHVAERAHKEKAVIALQEMIKYIRDY